jgi:GAF domain-containing protein
VLDEEPVPPARLTGGDMNGDSGALRASLERLSGLAPAEVDIEALLREVIGAVAVLFRVDGAGIMLVDDREILRSVAATDERGADLERAEQQAGTGPCIDGFIYDRPVSSADVQTDERYEAVRALLSTSRVRAVLGVPIRLAGAPVGVLDVYAEEPYEWTAEERDALVAYADLLGSLLGTALAAHRNDTLARQLQYALDHRVVIERAIGYLMGARTFDARAAFDCLRRSAREQRRRVADVATDVLETGSLDSITG